MDFGKFIGGVASSALSGLTNFFLGDRQSEREFERKKEMFDYQARHSERMYNKYQSPSALVEQYKSAGLNPASLAGTNIDSSSLASSPQADGPGISSPRFMDFNSGLQFALNARQTELNALMTEAQINNLDAQTKNLQSQTKERDTLLPSKLDFNNLTNQLLSEQIVGQKYKNSIDEVSLYVSKELADTQIALAEVDLSTAKTNLLKAEEELNMLRFDSSVQGEKFTIWRQDALKTIALKSAQISLAYAQRSFTLEQIDESLTRQGVNLMQIADVALKVRFENRTYEDRVKLLEEELKKIRFENKSLEITSSPGYVYTTTILDFVTDIALGFGAGAVGVQTLKNAFPPARKPIGY